MAFGDLRTWLEKFEAAGELKRISAEVDWNCEIGTIARRSFTTKGPALLFENIKDHHNTRGRRVATALFHKRTRMAMLLGFPPDTPVKELVRHVRERNRKMIPPDRKSTRLNSSHT